MAPLVVVRSRRLIFKLVEPYIMLFRISDRAAYIVAELLMTGDCEKIQ